MQAIRNPARFSRALIGCPPRPATLEDARHIVPLTICYE
jgi:hypothetical protein